MKTISILGCGWLGKPLAAALLRIGYNVSGSSTKSENLPLLTGLGIKAFRVNFNPFLEAPESQAFFKSEILVVNIPPRRKSGGESFYLKQMEEAIGCALEGDITKVIFVSSTSVYKPENRHVVETDADPDSRLVQAETLFLNQHKFKTTVLRFGGLVGPHRHPGRFLSGKEVAGADDPVNIIHLDDCIGTILEVLRKDKWNEVYNACSDDHPAKAMFYNLACRELNVPPPIFIEPLHAGYKIVSSDKIKRQLGYSFHYPDPMKMTYS